MSSTMSTELNTPEQRLARILLPASILREVDRIVLDGTGGYQTRQEFFSDAIQNHVLEIKHGVAQDGQISLARGMEKERAPTESTNGRSLPLPPADEAPPAAPASLLPEGVTELAPFADFEETAIQPPTRGAVVEVNGIGSVAKEPLFGMHNRDYPSLWLLGRIAVITREGPRPLQQVLSETTREAWAYGHRLHALEAQSKMKLTALFPTNTAKPQSAEEGFRAFALGDIASRPSEDGMVAVGGPLFVWGACQLVRQDGRLLLGVTEQGYDLLDLVAGLTLATPHERPLAEAFLRFLRSSSPWDWEGFVQILRAVAEQPTRAELVDAVRTWRPDWREAHANTNAAGYVARAREWGLVAPRLIDRRYGLTEFGEQMYEGGRS